MYRGPWGGVGSYTTRSLGVPAPDGRESDRLDTKKAPRGMHSPPRRYANWRYCITSCVSVRA